MRLLILPLIFTALSAAAVPKLPSEAPAVQRIDPIVRPPSDTCRRPEVHQAETPKPAKSSKLGELPDGDLILSVYNEVDGCMAPIVVRYGEGRAPAPAAPEPVRPRAKVWR